ncbi:tetratricopeptide repeat protein [Herbidospora galbida]|uniref:Tetratricopeptide repeat protein n=1 Tax=Herbidospora galbida TaxID=2575442 RepID=A0A4U3ML94_9ACTN|nr:tetratricopeptide repeat protein [Herbidospora galbida]TKK89740.1 tetratricopeptide repeat protein [Herbidospora galbida]
MSRSPSSFDIAFGLLREGRLVDAEQVMRKEALKVERRHGRGSHEWASVQCDLGNVFFASGQLDRAVDCFRTACSGTPSADHETRKEQLTYRLNLGMVLAVADRLDEAETELRRNLQEREDFYGREHPGYAFALEPLADLLLRRGDVARAREVIEEAVGNFWRSGHERVAAALAVRGEIIVLGGADEPPFSALDQLPDEVVEGIAYAAVERSGRDPVLGKAVLTRLVDALEARLGPDHQATLNALSQLANIGGDAGDEAGRIETIKKVLASYDRQGREHDAFMAALALAMAQDDAGDTTGALDTYARVQTRADGLGRPEYHAQLLRNWGLALAAAGRPAEAEERLRAAVGVADLGTDHEILGRSRIALGLFLQHADRLDEARHVVEAGLATLDVAHPDAITGRSHLTAIAAGRSCGCGDVQGAIADAFREFVLGRLPGDLLADLAVTVENGDFAINVDLRREPTEAEIEHLNQLLQSATAEFRGRLVAGG